jgi:putrescine aminotransferase
MRPRRLLVEPRVYSLDEALRANAEEIFELQRGFVNEKFIELLDSYRLLRQFVKAEGLRVWDSEGREHLDFLCSYGALTLGHNHPVIVDAVRRASSLPNLLQTAPGSMAACLASSLAAITPGGLQRSFFANSGSEAVEGAIKLARAATGRSRLIATVEGFHGKSMGALSMTGHEPFRTPYYPLLPDVDHVPFGDTDALEACLRRGNAAAFLVEPIQGPAGIIVPPEGYLRDVRELCDRHGALMMLDEIQTGFGRTGRMFACEHEDVVPDVMCLSKALGGGLYPIGAYITTDEVWRRAYGSTEKCLLHTSTFGGNSLACAAGIAVIQLTVEQNLPSRAQEIGAYFSSRLRDLAERHQLIKAVRGRGMMIGVDFTQASEVKDRLLAGVPNQTASMICVHLLHEYDIISLYTFANSRVIRFSPPLVAEREDLDRLVHALDEILTRNDSVLKLASSTRRLLTKK